MLQTNGIQNILPFYKYVKWLYPICRPVFPNYCITLKELGLAMVNCVLYGYEKKVLDVGGIMELTKRVIV